ncbi:DNA topoisomerase IB [Flavimaricola marinus]|uniref:DNA topoisomerase n=1 Tax=Flavimaricola marinus TaxID=1819565 RepID=A0A238L9S7_9RHOB|nr:DNA topoisomerase IB [Flavimaricola marinus]SMY06323.1 Eukaryotic DNA topoisomerase I, catalytic core [Flavimaricola marinus]
MTPGLVYVSDTDPGISRRRCGRGFTYIAPDGTTIARGPERKRIEALAVPPAYEGVWICPIEIGHIQATGRDARNRKQYRYHPDWSAAQAETKFQHLLEFGAALPAIRRRVDRDIASPPGDEEFALAAAIMLIDRTSLRVGNTSSARENGSYGALTLKRRHLRLSKDGIRLNFTAKSGKKVRQNITDRKLQKLLHKVSDLSGATLLSWTDDEGVSHSVSSQKLNAYLSDAAGDADITAKSFRTWAGTLAAFECAEKGGASISDMAQSAAQRLHNTPTVARNSYIHPAVIELADAETVMIKPEKISGLLAAEQRLMGYLATT